MRRLAVGIGITLVISACGGTAAPATTGRMVQIQMSDFTFKPDTLTLQAGEKVTLQFKNIGKFEHEFMAGIEPTIGGYAKDWLAGAQVSGTADHGMGHDGEAIRVAPNSTALVTFIVPEPGGAFEFACFLTSHYESGMRGRLLIDAAAAPVPGQSAGASRTPAKTAMPTNMPMGDDDGEGH